MTKGEFLQKFKDLPDSTLLTFCRDDGWGYDPFEIIQVVNVMPAQKYAKFECSLKGKPVIVFYT